MLVYCFKPSVVTHADLSPALVQVVFEPCQPLIVESFKSCEGLSRIAFLDGNTAVMLGKVRSDAGTGLYGVLPLILMLLCCCCCCCSTRVHAQC